MSSGRFRYERDASGRHHQFELEGLSPGAFNILARNLQRLGVALNSSEAKQAVSKAIAEDVRKLAWANVKAAKFDAVDAGNHVIAQRDASKGLDGNRITAVVISRSKSGQYGVYMKSPRKSGGTGETRFPDAYFIEYGYGMAADNEGGDAAARAALSRGGKRGARMPRGYKAGSHARRSESFRQGLFDGRGGWYYYDQWNANKKMTSRGMAPKAPLNKARAEVVRQLRDRSSGVMRRVYAALGDVIARRVSR